MKECGLAIFSDPGADRPLKEIATAQCVHCGGHFPICPNSGIIRGYCQNCAGPVCGPSCADCVPVEQLLDNLEHGLPETFRTVSVPVSFTGE
jgi:hypothetical protein